MVSVKVPSASVPSCALHRMVFFFFIAARCFLLYWGHRQNFGSVTGVKMGVRLKQLSVLEVRRPSFWEAGDRFFFLGDLRLSGVGKN